MNEMILDSNKNFFEKEIFKKRDFVLIYFWAEWCSPCKRMSPIISEISNEIERKLFVLKLNVDENSSLIFKYGIRSIPSFLLFHNGEKIGMKVGSFSKGQLKDFIFKHLDG